MKLDRYFVKFDLSISIFDRNFKLAEKRSEIFFKIIAFDFLMRKFYHVLRKFHCSSSEEKVFKEKNNIVSIKDR